MSKQAQALFAKAIALPEEDRAALAVQLLDSIRTGDAVAAAHASESTDRLAASRRGEMEFVSAEDALRIIAE